MLIKIYFDDKPVFLADQKLAELETYARPGVRWMENAGTQHLPKLIEEIQTPALEAAVLISKNPKDLLDGFKKQLHLVQAGGGLIHIDRSEVLLIFRRGKWDLPKGKLDEGEDLEQCALREIEEETGLKHLRSEGLLYVTYHTYHHTGKRSLKVKHVLKETYWYLVEGDRNDALMPQTDEDIEKCEWVKISDLAPYLENAHTSLIDVVAAGMKELKDTKKV